MKHAVLLPVLLLLTLAPLAPLAPLAAAEDDPLAAPFRDLFRAESPEAENAAIDRILAAKPGVPEILERLRAGPRRGMPSLDWSVKKHLYPDGVARPYHLFVPSTYDPAEPAPLLFHLHGGVNRPAVISEEQMKGYRDWWKSEAEEWGIVVVFPLGQQGAAWWDEVGARGIEGILRQVKRDVNVDEDRVFVTGFSDGGSGSFYLGYTRPTFFAGLIPLNGHPAVAAQASGRQLYPINAKVRPWYVVNTQADPLYPTRTVMPFVRAMIESDAAVRFTTYPGIGHEPAYRDEQDPMIARWLFETERDPLPASIVWETADVELGRVSWVTILALGETPGAPSFRDVNVTTPDRGVKLGVYLDREFAGPGVRVDRLVPGSVAETLALEAGDVITRVDDLEVADFAGLRAALGTKHHGEAVRLTWRRGEEERTGEATFPPFVPAPFFRRTAPSGRIEVAVEGNRVDVRLSGVTRYALDVSPDLFDTDEEIVVVTNGRESFRGKVEPDAAHLLRSYARDRDRSMLFVKRIEVEVGKAE